MVNRNYSVCFVMTCLVLVTACLGLSAHAQSTLAVVAPLPGFQADHGNAIGIQLRFSPPLAPGDRAAIGVEDSTAIEIATESVSVTELRTRVKLSKTSVLSAVIVRKGGAVESINTSAQVSIPASLVADDKISVQVRISRINDSIRKFHGFEGDGCVYLLTLVNSKDRFLREAKLGGNAEVRFRGSEFLSRNPFIGLVTVPPISECNIEYTLSDGTLGSARGAPQ